jgi:hypothetical protein
MPTVEVQRIRDGLWRWTLPHPDWVAGGSGPYDWPQRVGCVYYEAPDATVVIDPLVPAAGSEDERRFWEALDRDVERRGLPVAVLRTIEWHDRSCAAVRARYPSRVDAPACVEPLPVTGDPWGEVDLYLAEHAALVVGDILLGSDVHAGVPGELRVCPADWYDGDAAQRWHRDGLPAAIEPWLERPIEMVLVAHGTPVLAGGAAAVRHALDLHAASAV